HSTRWEASAGIACRTGAREHPKRWASVRSVGNASPGRTFPSSIIPTRRCRSCEWSGTGDSRTRPAEGATAQRYKVMRKRSRGAGRLASRLVCVGVVEAVDLRRTYRTSTGTFRRRELEVEAVRGVSFEIREGE